ncbi:MAG TPA: hypothetical protein EYQ66_08040 [Myxococcales bacterium]|nr:hypothetical protein [Myxococcales bacterium]
MAQSAPPKSRRTRWILLAFLVLAGLLVLLNRSPEVPPDRSAAVPPELSSTLKNADAQAPNPDPSTEESPEDPVADRDARLAQDFETDPERDAPAADSLAETVPDGESSGSRKVEEALARARTMDAIRAGIRAARANPRLPAAVIEEIQRPTPIPHEIQESLRQVNLTPPEILEGLRQAGETPPEIAQAMAEAQERGTSDAMRAYMAGETDERPEY